MSGSPYLDLLRALARVKVGFNIFQFIIFPMGCHVIQPNSDIKSHNLFFSRFVCSICYKLGKSSEFFSFQHLKDNYKTTANPIYIES